MLEFYPIKQLLFRKFIFNGCSLLINLNNYLLPPISSRALEHTYHVLEVFWVYSFLECRERIVQN